MINYWELREKKLTPNELKKREDIAKAIERDNPGIDKSKKMAIATAQAKKVAEDAEPVNEISQKTKDAYFRKSVGDHQHANAVRKDAMSRGDDALALKMKARMKKRNQGQSRALGQTKDSW